MHKVLDDFIKESGVAFAEKRASVMTVDGLTIIADIQSGETSDERFQVDADDAVVGDAYRRTARIISPDIARTYTAERAKRKPEAEDDFDDALIEAREDVAALHLLENLQVRFDPEATRLSDSWFGNTAIRSRNFHMSGKSPIGRLFALSTDPQDVDLARPVSRFEKTTSREKDGSETAIQVYERHLLCDEQGSYPAELQSWEQSVLNAETARKGFQFWYRNPGRPSQDSLGIAYMEDDDTKIMRPDFIFFAKEKGKIVADLIDPHGTHLADALPKLQGLAYYAEAHSQRYRRIEAVAKEGEKLRVLDLTSAKVRKAVKDATSAKTLYKDAVAGDYP